MGCSWRSLADRVHYVGSIKFDPDNLYLDPKFTDQALSKLRISAESAQSFSAEAHIAAKKKFWRRFLSILRKELPNLFLIIAPRHAERAHEVRRNFGATWPGGRAAKPAIN